MVIREWRATILRAILVILIVTSIPITFALLLPELTAQKVSFQSYAMIGVDISLIVLIFIPRISYRARVFWLLLIGYSAAIANLVSVGIWGNNRILFIVVSILALLLLGKRACIFVAVSCAVPTTVITILDYQGILVPGPIPSIWSGLIGTLAILTMVVTLLLLFYRLQERIVENEHTLRVELIQAHKSLAEQNASLEKKVVDRTTQLQQSNKLLSAMYKMTDAASGAHDLHEFFTRIHQIIGELMYAGNIFIALYDDSTGLLSFPYFVDEKDEPFPTQPLDNFHGMTSYVIRSGNSIKHGSDQFDSLLSNQEVNLEGTLNEDGMGAPLIVNDKIIGAIFVQSYIKGIHYTEQDDEVLASVAKHIATALIRFRALEAERQRTTELAIINNMQSGLAAGLEFQAIINRIGDQLRETLPAPNLTINLYDEKTNLLQYLYVYEHGERLTIPDVEPLPGSVVDKLIRAHTTSYLKYSGKRDEKTGAIPGASACKSGIAIPIVSSDCIWGVIQLEDFEREYAYGESEIRLLTTIAASLGAALENVRLSSQRNEAIEALRQSEEKFRKIVNSLPQAVSIWDMNMECTYVSPSIYKIMGYTPDEMLALRKAEFIASKSAAVFNKTLEESLSQEQDPDKDPNTVLKMDLEETHKNGSRVILENTFTFLRDAAGAPVSILSISEDITQRKRAERKLRESEEKLRLIFENAFDGISIYEEKPEEDRRILLECNERYCQMAGRSKEELLALPDTRAVQRDLGTITGKSGWEQISQGKAFLGTFSWIRPDGKENIIEYNAAPTRAGGRYYTVGLDRDITERRLNEKKLRESEQRLMDIINFLPLATMVINKDGQVTAWNQAMEEMTGVKSEDILGKGNYEYALPFYGIRRPILIDLVFSPVEEMDPKYEYIRRQGGILSAESFCEKLGKNGRMLIGFSSALYGSDGQIRGAIESIQDVTDLRQAEKELEEAKDIAEAANRSKSAFLANMSHEIRTPMNAILGFTQLMQRSPDLSAMQREHLSIINRSGEHLLALINDILELSKIEAGRSTYIPNNFDLHKLLTDLELMFRVRTDEKRLRLMLEMAGDVPHWVITDEGKLRQVLINLIGNAVKFTDQGGVGIRIGIQPGQRGKNNLLFEVEDTGPGISAEEIDNLFKPFEQTSSGIKMGGTGLGLSLSQGFIQIMGGTITVSSVVGKGSIFRFSIPFDEGKEDGSEQKKIVNQVAGLKPGQGEFRVLIADDRDTNRQILAQMLFTVGFKIREVTNGAEAIEAFHTWKPRIILMDMRMPVMNGYEATRKIKEDEEGKKTVVIAVTASAFQEDRQQIMASGADGYISKPFKEVDLFETIRQLTGVNYLYENEAAEKKEPAGEDAVIWRETVAALPADLVCRCREAAENADIFQLLELITEISTRQAHIGERLNALAQRYAYEEIVNLLTVEG